ncbi:MAG: GWxTD domain-containing protein [Ignavibacteria bacterium]
MKKVNVILIALILLTANRSFSDFKFYYDICPFKYDDDRLYFEMYYSFSQTQLKFLKTGAGYEADGFIELDIRNLANNEYVIQKQFKVPIAVQDTTGYNRSSSLTGQINFLLDSGKYSMKILASDFNDPSDSGVYEKNLQLVRFAPGKLSMSGIQLCSNILKSSEKQSPFYKNTLEVIPNPTCLFGSNLTTLFYYYEIYNLTKENITENYKVVTQICDLNNNSIVSSEKEYSVKNSSSVEYGSFDVAALKTNSYKVIVKVLNDKNELILSNQKSFYIYNKDTSSTTSLDFENSYLLSEYAGYTEEQLDKEFSYALYIASDVEREQFDNIKNLEGKRKFMYNFWSNKQISKKDYMNRVNYANAKLTYAYKEGYKTDRGRVFCIYGKPDDIDRYPFQPDTREYEIWTYNAIQGGVIFVFIDISNDGGDYVLTHSTAQNEVRNDNWQDKVRIVR